MIAARRLNIATFAGFIIWNITGYIDYYNDLLDLHGAEGQFENRPSLHQRQRQLALGEGLFVLPREGG